MKKRTYHRLLPVSLLAGFSALVPSFAVAQESGEGTDVYELSPFVVEAEENQGYMATTTLAGTRLKTALRDVGSAISVMTEEFFEDTGATDAASILSYGLNTEVAGVMGNFADVVSANDSRSSTIESRSSSQNSQRVRGLSQASLTRNFFVTDIPFDKYNSTSVTIQRGPNAVLYGIGSAGGVIDNTTKQAYSNKDFGEFSIRIGERGSHRETLDFNRVLIKDRLGLRVSVMNEDTEYQQKPAYEEDQRIYAALSAVLFENKGSNFLDPTRFRANFEAGEIKGTPPNPVPFSDGISHWFGLPDNLDQIVAITGVEPSPFVDNFQPKFTVDNRNGDINLNYMNEFGGPIQIPFFIQMPYIYTDPHSPMPSVGLADPTIAGVQGRVRWAAGGAQNVPEYVVGNSELYSTENYLGNNRSGPPRAPGFSYPVIMDKNIYDNEKMLLSGTSNRREQDFDAISFSLDQTFWDGTAGINVNYDKQDYSNFNYLPFSRDQFQDLKIDISKTLANGQANPNFGRAFIWETGTEPRRRIQTERESRNATAFYNLDLSDTKASWLGRHVLTGFISDRQIDRLTRNFRNVLVDIGDTDVQSAMNARVFQFRRSLPVQVYVSDSLLGSDIQSPGDVRITDYFTGSVPEPGHIVRSSYSAWNPVFGTENDRILTDEFMVEQFLIEGGANRVEVESKMFNIQSFLLNDHLVGMVAWREDEQTTMSSTGQARFSDGAYDPDNLLLDPETKATEKVTPFTWSVVGHIPKKWLPLPMNSELSLHYNESENFNPIGTRRTFYKDILSAPSGTTKEYGFTLLTNNGKLSIRVNWFETISVNTSVSSPVGSPSWISGGLTRYKDAELGGETLEDTLAKSVKVPNAAELFPTWDSLYDEMLSMLPGPVLDRWEGFDESGDPQWTPNPGQSITRDFSAEGFEVDIVGSLTKNWTVALNIAKQETVTSNSAPVASDFVFEVFENLQNSPLGNMIDSPVQNEPTTFIERWTAQQLNPVNRLLGEDGRVSQEQRKWRANLVTNYKFSDGRFAGFGIGGALRWQDKVATGYEIEVEDGLIVTPLLDKPFFGNDELNGDIWFSYSKKLGNGIDWKIQLNIRNLIRDDEYIPVVTNPDGRVAVVRNPPPREIFITNTFKF